LNASGTDAPPNAASDIRSHQLEPEVSNSPPSLSTQPCASTGRLPDAGLQEVEVPGWIGDALKYFVLIDGGVRWTQLVGEWQRFEASLGHPDGQNRQNRLPTKARPEEIKIWTKNARDYEKLPKVKSVQQYATTWKQWWAELQPESRTSESDTWPMPRVEPIDPLDWDLLQRGGCNGFFLVVISLAWWVSAALLSGEGLEEAMHAVEDVSWVCRTITTGGGASAPAPTSKCVAYSSMLDSDVPAKRQRSDNTKDAPASV
ncbi:hypothetical protein TRAPUB_1204, partial [Trametes pubescens]